MNKTLSESEIKLRRTFDSSTSIGLLRKKSLNYEQSDFEFFKAGYQLGQQAQDLGEPFAYVIDDGFKQQITVVVQDDTRETAKRFGWDIMPLYAIPSPPTKERGE